MTKPHAAAVRAILGSGREFTPEAMMNFITTEYAPLVEAVEAMLYGDGAPDQYLHDKLRDALRQVKGE